MLLFCLVLFRLFVGYLFACFGLFDCVLHTLIVLRCLKLYLCCVIVYLLFWCRGGLFLLWFDSFVF